MLLSQVTVKLQHVSTSRQIGEVVTAHYLEPNVMAFELTSAPGRYLKVKESGGLDYASGLDDSAKFRIEAVAGGNVLYLAVKRHENSMNRVGGIGWYLGISAQGQLYCDGGKDAFSQWALVAAAAEPAPAADGTTARPPAGQITHHTPAGNEFPGFAAGKDDLVRYFATPAGEAFLSQAQYAAAKALGPALAKLLHRPDWPLLALHFVDPVKPVPYDEGLANRAADFACLKSFFDQGYMLLPSVIPAERVEAAMKIVQYWTYRHMGHKNFNAVTKGKHGTLELAGDICQDADLLSLYYTSALPHLLQRIMGRDDVDLVKTARVLCTYPSLDVSEMSPALLGDQWNIEGFTKDSHSPYNILIGVALTDMTSTDMGNFCVHPGSHMALMEQYFQQAEGKQTMFSDDPKDVKKTDLGEPLQLIMHAGDVFVCTQRLAHLLALNTSSTPSTFVFFRVSHVDHAVLKDPALQSIWVEYAHASYFLENELEPSKFGAQTAVPVEDLFGQQCALKPVPAPSIKPGLL